MQEVLDTGRYWRKPGIPIFERTTIKNYHPVKLDITDPSDSQSAFATALDRLGRVDMVVSNVGDSGHKWKSISSARSMLRGRLGRPRGIRSSKGGGSYRSPLPEAKEGRAPSQIPRNINPTNTYTRLECLRSKSTAPPHGPSKALPKSSPTKSKQNRTSTSHASSPAVSAYWTGRSVDFPTQPTTT